MKVLPYPEKPMFLCYHNRAFPFGIIQANSSEDITKWVCTKCVNCDFFPNSTKINFNIATWDVWGKFEGLMTQQVLQIKKDYLDVFNIDLLHLSLHK